MTAMDYLPPSDAPGDHLYVYATQRDDGFQYAVHSYRRGTGTAPLGLFVSRDDALMFADGKREREAIPVIVLPSAERHASN